jgi:hypothetical protein
MEDIRFFAVLNDNNIVVNIVTFPKNPDLVNDPIWKDSYIWMYDGNSWNALNELESFNLDKDSHQGDLYYVDNIIGEVQNYLNEQFSNAQENTIVINKENLPVDNFVALPPEIMLLSYNEPYKLKEYSLDKSITNNLGIVESTYDEELNAFIIESEDETYNLNFETFQWEPDLNIDYDLQGDGIMYRWDGDGWILSSEFIDN